MKWTLLLILCVFAAAMAGCAPAPAAPTTADPPLDPALRESANRELSAGLQATDPVIRVHALEGIVDGKAMSHKDEILHALSDSDPHVRYAAALAAGQLEIHEAQWPLLNIADDPSENVRVAVRFALHKLGYKKLSHDLEAMATDPNPLVRGNTAYVLGMLGEPSAIPILRQLDKDPEPPVREQAAEALWRLGNQEGLDELIGLSVSGHPDDQMFALLALAEPRNTKVRQEIRIAMRGVSDVRDSTPSEKREIEQPLKKYGDQWALAVPLVAARAMGMLGSDEGIKVAAYGSISADPQLRMLAALAFGAIGRSDTQWILQKLLADQDTNVRIAAATAILQLKPPA